MKFDYQIYPRIHSGVYICILIESLAKIRNQIGNLNNISIYILLIDSRRA